MTGVEHISVAVGVRDPSWKSLFLPSEEERLESELDE